MVQTRAVRTHMKRTIDELAAAAEAEFRRLESRILLLKEAVAEEKALTKKLKAELAAIGSKNYVIPSLFTQACFLLDVGTHDNNEH